LAIEEVDLEALVFINFKQALGFGHVGWGFQLDGGAEGESRYVFGSSDHLYRHSYLNLWQLVRYSHVPRGGDTDFWIAFGSREDMLAAMKSGPHIVYHAAKVLPVEDARPGCVEPMAQRLRYMGWSILGNNCVDQALQLLRAYGVPDRDLGYLQEDSRHYSMQEALSRKILRLGDTTLISPVSWFESLPGKVIQLFDVQFGLVGSGS